MGMNSKIIMAMAMAAAMSPETNMVYDIQDTTNQPRGRRKKRYIPKSKNRRTKNKYCMR